MPPYDNTLGNLTLPTLSLMNSGGSGNNSQSAINPYSKLLGTTPSLANDLTSHLRANYSVANPGAPTTYTAAAQNSMGFNTPTDGSNTGETGMFGGLGAYMDKLGVTGPEGQLFGLSKDQQQGLGDLAGLGSGVWNMYNANRQYDMAKDYYGKQMELQDKQMARVDKEDARMEGMRSGLAKNY